MWPGAAVACTPGTTSDFFLRGAEEAAGRLAERQRAVGDHGSFDRADAEAVEIGRLGVELRRLGERLRSAAVPARAAAPAPSKLRRERAECWVLVSSYRSVSAMFLWVRCAATFGQRGPGHVGIA